MKSIILSLSTLFLLSGCVTVDISIKDNSNQLTQNIVQNDIIKFIEVQANKHYLEKDFVFSIIKIESGFDANAVNKTSNALGLMQIMTPAVDDVMKHLYSSSEKPSEESLMDPYTNVKIGVGYLYLLKHRYYKDIDDITKKRLVVAAAYNAGPTRVASVFSKNNNIKQAIKRINSMSYNQFLSKMDKKLPSETAIYIKKVKKILSI